MMYICKNKQTKFVVLFTMYQIYSCKAYTYICGHVNTYILGIAANNAKKKAKRKKQKANTNISMYAQTENFHAM